MLSWAVTMKRCLKSSVDAKLLQVRTKSSVSAGIALGYCGEELEALRWFEIAIRASPRDPRCTRPTNRNAFRCLHSTATRRLLAQRNENASGPQLDGNIDHGSGCLRETWQYHQARNAVESLRRIDPGYSVRRALRRHPYRDPAERESLLMRSAGRTFVIDLRKGDDNRGLE